MHCCRPFLIKQCGNAKQKRGINFVVRRNKKGASGQDSEEEDPTQKFKAVTNEEESFVMIGRQKYAESCNK